MPPLTNPDVAHVEGEYEGWGARHRVMAGHPLSARGAGRAREGEGKMGSRQRGEGGGRETKAAVEGGGGEGRGAETEMRTPP